MPGDVKAGDVAPISEKTGEVAPPGDPPGLKPAVLPGWNGLNTLLGLQKDSTEVCGPDGGMGYVKEKEGEHIPRGWGGGGILCLGQYDSTKFWRNKTHAIEQTNYVCFPTIAHEKQWTLAVISWWTEGGLPLPKTQTHCSPS